VPGLHVALVCCWTPGRHRLGCRAAGWMCSHGRSDSSWKAPGAAGGGRWLPCCCGQGSSPAAAPSRALSLSEEQLLSTAAAGVSCSGWPPQGSSTGWAAWQPLRQGPGSPLLRQQQQCSPGPWRDSRYAARTQK
jgi:hypothetical protein